MNRQQLLDLYFLEARAKLIDLAAFFDRLDQSQGEADFRLGASRRAGQFGLPQYCWLCINPKESEDVGLATEVIGLIPKFLDRPNVLGIGEIGLNKNSRNELKVLEMHVDLAARHQQLILVHTP